MDSLQIRSNYHIILFYYLYCQRCYKEDRSTYSCREPSVLRKCVAFPSNIVQVFVNTANNIFYLQSKYEYTMYVLLCNNINYININE